MKIGSNNIEIELEGPAIPENPEIPSEVEYILYDEAIKRAGGFGLYQVILFCCISLLGNYGQ